METRLNDNEVREVARMQQLIDRYEAYILALFFMTKGKRVDYPLFPQSNVDKPMNAVWRWIKERSMGNKEKVTEGAK